MNIFQILFGILAFTTLVNCQCMIVDGEIGGTEQCDDNNQNNGDGCSDLCAIEPGWTCAGEPSVCTPICGDAMVLGLEECDDGNINPTDGCSATCTIEDGFTCADEPSECTRVPMTPDPEESADSFVPAGVISIAILIPICLCVFVAVTGCYAVERIRHPEEDSESSMELPEKKGLGQSQNKLLASQDVPDVSISSDTSTSKSSSSNSSSDSE